MEKTPETKQFDCDLIFEQMREKQIVQDQPKNMVKAFGEYNCFKCNKQFVCAKSNIDRHIEACKGLECDSQALENVEIQPTFQSFENPVTTFRVQNSMTFCCKLPKKNRFLESFRFRLPHFISSET